MTMKEAAAVATTMITKEAAAVATTMTMKETAAVATTMTTKKAAAAATTMNMSSRRKKPHSFFGSERVSWQRAFCWPVSV